MQNHAGNGLPRDMNTQSGIPAFSEMTATRRKRSRAYQGKTSMQRVGESRILGVQKSIFLIPIVIFAPAWLAATFSAHIARKKNNLQQIVLSE